MTPEHSYLVLLVVQALHLLHHRLAKRHISFAEVASATLLCVPPMAIGPAWAMIAAHLTLAGIQVIGSLNIRRFSPDWKPGSP